MIVRLPSSAESSPQPSLGVGVGVGNFPGWFRFYGSATEAEKPA